MADPVPAELAEAPTVDLASALHELRFKTDGWSSGWSVEASLTREEAVTLLAEYDRRGREIERQAAKINEASFLADHLDGEASTYPGLPGASALRSAAARIRAALAYEVHNPLNHEEGHDA